MKQYTSKLNIILTGVLVAMLITNQFLLMEVNSRFSGALTAMAKELTGDVMGDSIALTVSSGIPPVYGAELGISFDNVQKSINIMRQLDPAYGTKEVGLNQSELKRYIDIDTRIACEYCCGAKSLVFSDGRPACGCAHSIAMRGLTAYLLKFHGSRYTNDEILREVALWKGMFFPKQMIAKMAKALTSGQYSPDVASIAMGIDLPKYSKNSASAPLPSEIKNLPGMVGGC